MKLDPDKINQIQIVLIHEDDFVEFADGKFEDGLWYVSSDRIHRFGEETEEGSKIEETFSIVSSDRPYSEFYKQIEGKELAARIWVGKKAGHDEYQGFTNWEDLAKAIGISELVTLATKVPKTIAKRFTVFANQRSDRSSILRQLVYDYVKQQIIEQADSLMFKEEI